MRGEALIDTGAILALLDASDPWHGDCAAAVRGIELPLVTTAAVVTEALHFLIDHRLPRAWRFFRSPTITLLPIGNDDLPDLERLMTKYADRPMDFADAMLVRLAEREGHPHRRPRFRDLPHRRTQGVPDPAEATGRRRDGMSATYDGARSR